MGEKTFNEFTLRDNQFLRKKIIERNDKYNLLKKAFNKVENIALNTFVKVVENFLKFTK